MKYKNFQYRLLHNIIFANDRLFYFGKKPTQECDYCTEEKQTVEHMLYSCKVVKIIWDELYGYIITSMNVNSQDIEIRWSTIMLNLIHAKNIHVVNYMCLIVKQYMYRNKCFGKIPNIEGAIAQIHKIYLIEKYNAVQHMKKFNIKWECYQLQCESEKDEND